MSLLPLRVAFWVGESNVLKLLSTLPVGRRGLPVVLLRKLAAVLSLPT